MYRSIFSRPRHNLEASGQLHAPAALTPGKEPPVPIGEEVGLIPEPVWTTWRRENSWFYRESNSGPSVVQPVASHYTDCAIPGPHIYLYLCKTFPKISYYYSDLSIELLIYFYVSRVQLQHWIEFSYQYFVVTGPCETGSVTKSGPRTATRGGSPQESVGGASESASCSCAVQGRIYGESDITHFSDINIMVSWNVVFGNREVRGIRLSWNVCTYPSHPRRT
jgi:hypothetical protein